MKDAIAFCCAIVITVCILYAMESNGGRLTYSQSIAVEQGARAAKAGVPANANPYTGDYGRLWLDAWIDAKENAQ